MFDYIERASDVFLASLSVNDTYCEHFCYVVPDHLATKRICDTKIMDMSVRKDRSGRGMTMLASAKSHHDPWGFELQRVNMHCCHVCRSRCT